jgi:hypothetical protein
MGGGRFIRDNGKAQPRKFPIEMGGVPWSDADPGKKGKMT